jgi:hypothetical protein
MEPNFNYEAQEEVVAALWSLIEDNGKQEPNCTHVTEDGRHVQANLGAIADALAVIMDAFGYQVQPTD